ncbi:MAG TPA: hypothetical protein VFH54_12670 [Mycobacteriales bacterium]|nr:hypothetical protein [Mycobacteriales bacterium]
MTLKDYCTGSEHDLVPGRLRLYRTWAVDREGDAPALRATNFHIAWTREMQARCLRRECEHDQAASPVEACTCGIYGWYDPHDTRIVHAPVVGVIEAWGHCILGSNGARVEHARLVAVAPNPRCDVSVLGAKWLRQALAAELGRGTEVYWSFDALIRAHPPISVRELAGDPVEISDPTVRVTATQIRDLGQAIARGLADGIVVGRHARRSRVDRVIRWLFEPWLELIASAIAAGRRHA